LHFKYLILDLKVHNVDDFLAHAYEKNGQIDMAMKQWEKLLNTDFKNIAEKAIKELKTKGKFSP